MDETTAEDEALAILIEVSQRAYDLMRESVAIQEGLFGFRGRDVDELERALDRMKANLPPALQVYTKKPESTVKMVDPGKMGGR